MGDERDGAMASDHLVRRSIVVLAALVVVAVGALIVVAILVAKGFGWLADQSTSCDGCG